MSLRSTSGFDEKSFQAAVSASEGGSFEKAAPWEGPFSLPALQIRVRAGSPGARQAKVGKSTVEVGEAGRLRDVCEPSDDGMAQLCAH